MTEHPDYLFARLNQAHDYIKNGEYEKVPLILGEAMEIKTLYPERDVFHLTEITAYLKTAIRYFAVIDNLKLAENRLDIMKEIAPDHHDTEEAETYLFPLRLKAGALRWEEEIKQRIAPVVNVVSKKKNHQPPAFNHPEIACLYEYGLKIPHEKLKEILTLPHPTLIEDLETILSDAVNRYGHFSKIKWEEKTHTFLLHALFLLMELKSEKSLPIVLKTLESDNEFIEFWIGNHLTDTVWQCLYKLGFNQTGMFQSFLIKPGIDTFCKTAVSDSLCQMVLHHPERREEIAAVYEEIFTTFANAFPHENLIDTEFLGLAVGDTIDAKLKELLPAIKILFDKKLVALGVNGDFQKVKKYFSEPEKFSHKREIYSIFELYDNVLKTWAGYTEKKEKNIPEKNLPQPVKSEKIKRNDPCPCGSGKKYKKCCMK